MALSSGTRLGPYEILSLLGAGGMGEVYKAKDTRLDRTVAIKVLPSHLSGDPDRRQRFEREAKAVSSLNHPHICTLHDIGEQDGVDYLVMEYIEGDDLADRLKKGPLPLDQALQYATQISDALDKAHRAGVVHRDLKPGNIMLTKAGAKLLDFGLAKLRAPGSTPDLSALPTEQKPLTEKGAILGTFQYMAPEQLEGKEVDGRTDIFAFGAVFYEMLTGKRTFEGKSQASLISAIMKDDPPPMSTLQPMTPPLLEWTVKRCLEKHPDERWQTACDLHEELKWIAETGFEAGVTSAERPRSHTYLAWGLSALLAVVVAGIAAWNLRPAAPRPVAKLLMGVEPAEWLGVGQGRMESRLNRTAIVLSPDGRFLVYSAGDDQGSRLYLRPMDEIEAKPISGTEGGVGPFFSPDGQWIGFWAGGKLKKVPIDGGPPMALCDVPALFGASWGPDDTIVFGQLTGGILRISAGGGAPEAITTLAEGEVSHRLPYFLPDGKAILFTVMTRLWGGNKAQIVAQSLESKDRKVLVKNGADGRYSPTGHLVFIRLGTLMAATFDPTRLEITGDSVALIGDVRQAVNTGNDEWDSGAAQFSFSASGSLVFVPGGIWPDWEGSLVWVDRKGVAEPLQAPPAPYWSPRISPDGQRVAFNTLALEKDIWVHDISRGTSTRLTMEESVDMSPLWSPDGARITFKSNRSGRDSIWVMPADGSGPAERLTTIEGADPASWSSDGQVLAFLYSVPEQGWDIWMLPLGGEPQPFIQSPFKEQYPTFSPDGRWLAYVSNQSGRNEVYVTPYPGPGPRIQISTAGGAAPAWVRSGRELFYRSPRGIDGLASLNVVDIKTAPNFSAGKPRELFKHVYDKGSDFRTYDVSPDGQRFLMVQSGPGPGREPVTQLHVVLNWFEELKRLAPTN